MTKQEAKEFIVQSIKDDVDVAKIAYAIRVLEQNQKTEDDILKAIIDNCNNRSRCKGCKYLDNDALCCRFRDIPSTWVIE